MVPSAICLTLALALGGFSGGGYASNHQDLAGKRVAPFIFGLTNGASSIAGTAAVYFSGAWRDAGADWDDIWALVAGIYVIGAGIYVVWGRAEPVEAWRKYDEEE